MQISSISFLHQNKVNNNKNIAISNPYSINAISFKGLDKDTFSFSNKPKLLSAQEGKIYADKYKNSTSGYRGEFQKDFNDDFVYTMTHASGEYMIKHKNSKTPKTVVAGDTRQATKKYAPIITKTLTQKGIDVFSPRLDEVEGIGKRRKMTLLKAFNSIEEIASSSVEKLVSLGIPKKIAEELLNKLNTK